MKACYTSCMENILEIYEEVAEELDNLGVECSVITYSGRGMYGAEVTAFDLPNPDDLMMVGYAFGILGYAPDMVPTRTDNLGRGIVVY